MLSFSKLPFVVILIFINLLIGISEGKVTKGELAALGNELWELDQNRIGNVLFQTQQHLINETDPDQSPERFFGSVSSDVFELPSFKSFVKLLDNYNPNVVEPEDNNSEEQLEENQFLDYVLDSQVMKRAWQFLVSKNLSSSDPQKFREELKTIWFGAYSRGVKGVLGSTGFEHVFAGEVKKSKVSGFHNWVRFYLEEQKNAINYGGFYKMKDLGEGSVVSTKFQWNNYPKVVGSMFISTSPEFEMAVYTVCFYTRPNNICKLQFNHNAVYFRAYTLKANNINYIGSAYPTLDIA